MEVDAGGFVLRDGAYHTSEYSPRRLKILASIGWRITYEHPAPDLATFPAIPERVETFILTMINRMNAFTVLALMFMRVAISLLVRPWRRNSTVSPSRCVRPNCAEISASAEWLFPVFRSSNTAKAGCGESFPLKATSRLLQM